jgi:hypothetical protein
MSYFKCLYLVYFCNKKKVMGQGSICCVQSISNNYEITHESIHDSKYKVQNLNELIAQ